jgi:hypothetical protein
MSAQLNAASRSGVERLIATGKVLHRVGDIAYLDASLADSSGVTLATATAIARVIPLEQARHAV